MTILLWILAIIIGIIIFRAFIRYYVKEELESMGGPYLINPVEVDLNKHYLLLMDNSISQKEFKIVRDNLKNEGYPNILIVSGAKTIKKDN